MSVHLERGQKIRVNAYGGNKPYVAVVEDRGNVVLICKPSEFEHAKAENREPVCIGFHREDIIIELEDQATPKKHPKREDFSENRSASTGD